MRKIIFILLVLGIILVASCQREDIKPFEEKPAPDVVKTQIELENKGLEVVVSPTEGKKISGVVTIGIKKVPLGSAKLVVMLSPQGIGEISDPFNTPNVIMQYAETTEAEVLIDTKKVENGVYDLAVMGSRRAELTQNDTSPWVAVVQTQVIVEN